MIESEWLEIAAVIRERWPHATTPESTIARWYGDMADLDALQVAASIETLYRDGREFPPNPGLIRRRLAELSLDTPDWSLVIPMLRAYVTAPRSRVLEQHIEIRDGYEVMVIDREENPRADLLASAHPAVRGFIDQLGMEQVAEGAHPEASGGDEARLREKWKVYARALERDVTYAGIGDAGLPALQRANELRGAGEIFGGIRRSLERGKEAA